jgi:hypothetical protein
MVDFFGYRPLRPIGRRIIEAPEKFKNGPRPPFRSKNNETCRQKPNPSHETVPFSVLWVWNPGSLIRDPEKSYPEYRVKRPWIPNPRSATLILFLSLQFCHVFRFCSRTAPVCFCRGFSSCRRLYSRRRPPAPPPPPTWAGRLSYFPSRHAHSSTYQLESNPLRWSRVKLLEASMDQISIKTPNPKCWLS